MTVRNHTFAYRHFDSPGEIPEADRQLAEAAHAACATAYAPYSCFRVGAALRFDDGSVLSNSNQESGVLPSGMCAERGLLYYAQAHAAGRKIEALALVSNPDEHECTPCGACRQVITDTEKRQGSPIRVIMVGHHTATVVESGILLLPFAFEL